MSKLHPMGIGEEFFLLAILSHDNIASANEISRAINGATEADISIGSLYSTLHRLEDKQFIVGDKPKGQSSLGDPILYTVTSRGQEELARVQTAREKISTPAHRKTAHPFPKIT